MSVLLDLLNNIPATFCVVVVAGAAWSRCYG